MFAWGMKSVRQKGWLVVYQMVRSISTARIFNWIIFSKLFFDQFLKPLWPVVLHVLYKHAHVSSLLITIKYM